MQIQTFNIVVGTEACNARCPFCISKMTPLNGVLPKETPINWRNFRIAAKLAKHGGATTAMLTGKGEPTFYPNQITQYLDSLKEFDFPFIELQTNGIILYEKKESYREYLKNWYDKGLTTIAVSIAHYGPEKNREIYVPYKKQYIDLPDLINHLHSSGFSVRLTCVLADGYIGDAKNLENLIMFAKEYHVEQLKVTPVDKPQNSRDGCADAWVAMHYLKDSQLQEIKDYLAGNGQKLLELAQGTVYDVHGQNIALTSCLSIDNRQNFLKQIIFFPEGRIKYDWQYEGAVLL